MTASLGSWSSSMPEPSQIDVSSAPGTTTCTRTPEPANSWARAWVNAITYALLPLYTAPTGRMLRARADEMLTIVPEPRPENAFAAAAASLVVEVRLNVMSHSSRSGSAADRGPNRALPALFTSMSIEESASRRSSTLRMPSGVARSALSTETSTPKRSARFAAADSSRARSRATSSRSRPRAANSSA